MTYFNISLIFVELFPFFLKKNLQIKQRMNTYVKMHIFKAKPKFYIKINKHTLKHSKMQIKTLGRFTSNKLLKISLGKFAAITEFE